MIGSLLSHKDLGHIQPVSGALLTEGTKAAHDTVSKLSPKVSCRTGHAQEVLICQRTTQVPDWLQTHVHTHSQAHGHARHGHLTTADSAAARLALKDIQQHQFRLTSRVEAFRAELQ